MDKIKKKSGCVSDKPQSGNTCMNEKTGICRTNLCGKFKKNTKASILRAEASKTNCA